jgi:type I restriction enzyme, S subunit
MSVPLPTVPLGELLRHRTTDVDVQPTEFYDFAGVYSFGRGVFRREARLGNQFAYKRLSRLRSGDFVYPKLMAWEGAFGVVPKECDGCVVSPEFPVFEPRIDRVLPEFLSYYFRVPRVWEELSGGSIGTNVRRRRLHPSVLLRHAIRLPSLPEQRRIVARIEELAERISEAHNLRRQATEETKALLLSASAQLFKPRRDWETKSVGDFCEPPQYGYTESATTEPVGPRFLRITDIQDGRVNWNTVPYCRCPEPSKYLLKPNDLVFARTGATTGKSFVIRECPEAVFASYLIRLRVRNTVSVDYLHHYFQSPSYWEQIADEKKGTGQPNLNGSKLEKLKVPVAPLAEQCQIVAELDALQAKIDAIRALQSQTAEELDALLPAILDKAFKRES